MRRTLGMVLVMVGLVAAPAATAVPLQFPEGDLWGFPSLKDSRGSLLGRGRFKQWVDGRGIHVKVTYALPGDGQVEETALVSTTGGELAQRDWSWQRTSGGQVVERYEMNFDTEEGRSLVVRDGKRQEHRSKLEVVEGRTFAGLGFVFAVRNLYPRLVKGERLELEGIAFAPKARKAKVEISAVGVETVRMGGRSLRADHIVVHPVVPKMAKLFVNVSDNHLWFYQASPPAFLRARMPMQSLGMVQVDSLSGGATPSARTPRPPR